MSLLDGPSFRFHLPAVITAAISYRSKEAIEAFAAFDTDVACSTAEVLCGIAIVPDISEALSDQQVWALLDFAAYVAEMERQVRSASIHCCFSLFL